MPDQPQDSGQPVPAPAGGEVERFDPDYAGDMFENSGGSWVRYEDYEKLKEEYMEALLELNEAFSKLG